MQREPLYRSALVWGLAGSFLSWTLLPGLHWHDTGEFVAVARRLSLSHSPGHPLHALYTHSLQLLPLGDQGLRSNLGSALALALALALFYRLLRALSPSLHWSLAALTALTPLSLPGVWLQGARTEVYSLQLLLGIFSALLVLKLARGEQRALPLLAFSFGLAGANHSLLGAALIPLALFGMALGLRRLRALLLAFPAGALGLMVYLYLPLRAGEGGIIGWGRPDSVDAFTHMLLARDWMKSIGDVQQFDFLDNLANLSAYVIQQFGPEASLLMLLLFGLGLLSALRHARGALLGAVLVILGVFATKSYYAIDLLNPDLGGYLMAGLLAILALPWISLGALKEPIPRRLAFGGLLLLALIASLREFDTGQRRGSRSAEIFARTILAEPPPQGGLLISDYATQFCAWYLRAVEGLRPDLALIFRGRIHESWHRTRLADEHPVQRRWLDPYPQGLAHPSLRFEPGVEMERLGPLRALLRPVGLTLAITGPAQAALERWRSLDTSDLDARRSLAFQHLQRALHLRAVRAPRSWIRWHLGEAEVLAPGDPALKALP